ncbi:hypothetical protein ACFLXI_04600 [Chloroflexota bacterium]
MSEEFLEPITPEGEPDSSGVGGSSNNKILLIVAVALVVLCCCCFGGLAAIYIGTEPVMELLGIPIPW